MSLNKACLIGNVGRDPEVRSMNNGKEVASFSLATSESWKDKSTGERRDKTEWHNIVIFSPGLIGVVRNYVKKGTKLYIEGAIQTRKWTDKNGTERRTTEIVLQGYNCILQILTPKEQTGVDPSTSSNSKTNSRQSLDEEIQDDDIPF